MAFNKRGFGERFSRKDKIEETYRRMGDAAVPMAVKTYEIGDWNMDLDANNKIPHDLKGNQWKKIRRIWVLIRHDNDHRYYNLEYCDASNIGGGVNYVDKDNIWISRITNHCFDNNGFDSTDYNRGWVTVWYEAE